MAEETCKRQGDFFGSLFAGMGAGMAALITFGRSHRCQLPEDSALRHGSRSLWRRVLRPMRTTSRMAWIRRNDMEMPSTRVVFW